MRTFEREIRFATWPSIWARDRLDFQADTNQVAFLDSSATDGISLWSRQTGKTECMGLRISHTAVYRPSLQLVVSASQRQAGILQKRVISAMRRLR